MIYLLDVNALVALGFANHEFHSRVSAWVRAQDFPPLATCAITELGFVRVLAHAPAYGVSVTRARTLLLRIKEAEKPAFTFIVDDQDISRLPGWVKTANQTTDGHLASLAAGAGGRLATLDRRIPGSLLIPE